MFPLDLLTWLLRIPSQICEVVNQPLFKPIVNFSHYILLCIPYISSFNDGDQIIYENVENVGMWLRSQNGISYLFNFPARLC